MKNGRVFVFSGPAGSGKDTVLNHYFRFGNAEKTISATTRSPRPGETDKKDYYFISKEQFLKYIEEDNFAEYTQYAGNYYGTLKDEITRIIQKRKSVILKLETEGGANIKKLYKDAILAFLMPPSMRELERRLRARGTEDEEKIKERLAAAVREIEFAKKNYDLIIVNKNALKAAYELNEAILNYENNKFVKEEEKFEK